MYLPSPLPVSNTDIFINGDIQIDPSAVLGPGVILQAAPSSQILIGKSVCLGMGVIISAANGIIEIQNGAVLGAGVLVIGKGIIGNNACLGAATTVFNASVEPMTIVPAGSLIGDSSRRLTEFSNQEPALLTDSTSVNGAKKLDPTENNSVLDPEPLITSETEEISSDSTSDETPNQAQPVDENGSVIGKVYINQLLVTLFPEKQGFNNYKKPEAD